MFKLFHTTYFKIYLHPNRSLKILSSFWHTQLAGKIVRKYENDVDEFKNNKLNARSPAMNSKK